MAGSESSLEGRDLFRSCFGSWTWSWYLGLEWLRKTEGTHLKVLDISPEMIEIAKKNAKQYNLGERVTYFKSDAQKMPFEDNSFDAVFTNGSLHEWSEPRKIFDEIHRVLKPKGKYCISDLRRDMNIIIKWFMKLMTKPKEIKPGLVSSINSSCTVDEAQRMLKETKLRECRVEKSIMGLVITGEKSV